MDLENFYSQLTKLQLQTTRNNVQFLQGSGLTLPQFMLMRLVRTHPDIIQDQLTEMLGVTKGNVSYILNNLEQNGLVERTASGTAKQVRLTPAAEKIMAAIIPQHAALLNQFFSVLTADELAQFQQIVTKILQSNNQDKTA